MRQRLLIVERRYDDQARGSDLPCQGEQFLHRGHSLVADRGVFGDQPAIEARADGAHPDRPALECFLELFDVAPEISSADLQALEAPFFHFVQLLLEGFAGNNAHSR